MMKPKNTLRTTLLGFSLALFAVPLSLSALDATSSSETSSSTPELTKAQLFTICSQDAIELRDTKLAGARTTYNTAMNNLLVERKNSEKKAISIDDEKERKEAIKIAVEEYKGEVKTLQNTLTQARKTIWQNFENDMKSCRETLEKEDVADIKEDAKDAKKATTEDVPEARTMMTAKKVDTKEEQPENKQEAKTIKESFIDSIKSLFGKE